MKPIKPLLHLLPCLLTFIFLLHLPQSLSSPPPPATVCIIGSGISGASVAHFLRKYSPEPSTIADIHVFEKNSVVGGRMATITIANYTVEAGASIFHPTNNHALKFAEFLQLKRTVYEVDSRNSLGIWDGKKFLYKTWSSNSGNSLVNKVVSWLNSFKLLWRYGSSLFKMQNFVESMLDNFLKFYEGFDTRPVFSGAVEMLKWSGLYNLTSRTLEEELIDVNLSPVLIKELVTAYSQISYGLSANLSGLAGAFSLAGTGSGLWAVEGGNWQMPAGLIDSSDVKLHLNEEILSVTRIGTHYELESTKGNSYVCQVTIFATLLNELKVRIEPPISIPDRKIEHTHTTFVRGLLNPAYFGLGKVGDIPDLVATIEDSKIPFTCISVLKKHHWEDMTYKIFSRKPMDDASLDQIFSIRKETIQIDWAAYPHYEAPEAFAPYILDDSHLYYVDAFETAASSIEIGAVSGENIARLVLSRLSTEALSKFATVKSTTISSGRDKLYSDL